MSKAISIGNRQYKTKSAAQVVIKALLNSAPLWSQLSGEDDAFLRDLLNRHPDAAGKIGCGVDHFRVEPDEFKHRCFKIYRTDGSFTDFGYKNCLDGEYNAVNLVQSALRTATMDLCSEFRDTQFRTGIVDCVVSGVRLTAATCHIDHVAPRTFDWLYQAWMATNGYVLEDIRITASQDNAQGRTMTDVAQIQSWRAFHQQNAVLRLISVRANLSEAKIAANRMARLP